MADPEAEVSASSGKKSRRISGEEVLDVDQNFPVLQRFQPPHQLPTKRSVIGRVRSLTLGGKKNMNYKEAVREVAKEVYCKYWHDSVFCVQFETVVQRLQQLLDIFWEGKRRLKEKGKENSKAVKQYTDLVKHKDSLFEVSTDDPKRKEKCEVEWGIQMGLLEKIYLDDQRGERKMQCDHGTDPIWYRAYMKEQRMREKHDEEYVNGRNANFRGKNMSQIDDFLREQGELPSSTSPESAADTPVKKGRDTTPPVTTVIQPPKKKRRLYDDDKDEEDELPQQYRHIREGERKIKADFYKTCAELSAEGLSLDECANAVVLVGKGMFGRKWKKHDESETTIDRNTLPEVRHILEAIRQIEAHSLSLVVEEMQNAKQEGHMVTLASDSTTRRHVGKFIGMGIHIGKESAISLPLLGISGESKDEIAAQLEVGIDILSACSGKETKELMGQLDVLLTDSVEHNKGVNLVIQEMFDLDKPPGQIFCGTHTTLGFSNSMNNVVMRIEVKLKLETLLSKFMVGMELDSKNGSLAGQALDMMLKLVAPEYRHKAWNIYGLFTN